MPWIATSEQCREMDRQAEALGISVESLMHEAGRAVAACALEKFSEARRIVVLCGKGNNGGDGLVAARLLAEHQRRVEVLIAAPRSELNSNAERELERLREPGIAPIASPDREWESRLNQLRSADLLIDALLGTGAKGAPAGEVAQAIEAANSSGRPILAVDVPSGIDADSGAAMGRAIAAARTVTFGLAKPFAFQGAGLLAAGEVEVATIGFPEALLETPRQARTLELEDARARHIGRPRDAHKGSEGHVVILAGHDRMPGAAVLAARGALRAGAGLVTVTSTETVIGHAASLLPEAIHVPLPDEAGVLGISASDAVLNALSNADALVVGPGLGTWPETSELLAKVMQAVKAPAVIDADALNLIALGLDLPAGPAILTPHPGEAGRLLKTDSAQVQADRFASARRLAENSKKTVVLKGACSLVAEPVAPLWVNTTGNPGMASPGMGDVLAGLLGALLAKGLSPGDAAALGVYWHGLAGDRCAANMGLAGYLASEVADALPQARATIAST